MVVRTLSTMTVLPETLVINPACGVSNYSSDSRTARCADVNRPDTLLSQKSRHDLDLQLRFRRASPNHCDGIQLERDHVRPQDCHVGDPVALAQRERLQNG